MTTMGLSGSSPASRRAISCSRHSTWPRGVSLKASLLEDTTRRTRMIELPGEHARGRIARGPTMDALGLRVGKEAEALQAADKMLLHVHRPVLGDLGVKLVLFLQALHQRTGAPVDEALRQLLVERIGQTVLDGAGALLPMLGIGQPIDSGSTRKSRCGYGRCGLTSVSMSPSVRSASATCWANQSWGMRSSRAHQELVERGHQLGVVLRWRSCGNRAPGRRPTGGSPRTATRRAPSPRGRGMTASSASVSSAMRARASRPSRGASRRLSRSRSSEAKSRARLRHCRDFTGSKVWVSSRSMTSEENASTRARDPERAVVHVAAGAAGDLRRARRGQLAMHLAVELARAGEGHVIDIEVEPHADGVGGDQEVDVAGLIERDLRVARARAERAQHDGRPAALAADQLGDGVDLGRREGDERRARRQPRDLLLAGVGELGKPRTRDEVGAGNEVADGIAHGLGAEQQRLLPAAHVQQPIGEDVAALGVGGELHLVDGEEIDIRARAAWPRPCTRSSAAAPA